MNNGFGLTHKELQDLTGFSRASKQCEALAFMGIAFKVRPNGTPFVLRTELKEPQSLTTKQPKAAVLKLI